jgi:hypothetical protein
VDITEQQKQLQRIAELKKTYSVKPFESTTEAMEFMEDFAEFSSLKESVGTMEEFSMTEIFKILKPKFVKKILEKYLLKNGSKVDYETYFLGKLDLMLTLFMLVMQELGESATGGNEEPQLKSNKR